RALAVEAPPQPAQHGHGTRRTRFLVEVRVPPGAEVQSVERHRQFQVHGLRLLELGRRNALRQRAHARLVDAHQLAPLGDERAAGADVLWTEPCYSPSSALMAP